MRKLRGTYVHKGDAARRRARIKRTVLLGGVCGATLVAWDGRSPSEAKAAPAFFATGSELREMREQLEATQGELELANAQLQRWNRIYNYSSHYGIGADMAAAIYDIAQAEGIEPELGFRLVRVESVFNPRATSPVGAVGLTQLMLPTARFFEKGVTKEQLYDRDTNLRIGFRYLRALIREYKGDVNVALLVYNRGPVAVKTLRGMGLNPSNGYDKVVMKGYKGKGTVD
jgi:soluble lytic murein transglycosylase-like protein